MPTAANGGYLDPTNYRTHLILVSQIRQSHTNLMNIVFTFRNSDNSSSVTGKLLMYGVTKLYKIAQTITM